MSDRSHDYPSVKVPAWFRDQIKDRQNPDEALHDTVNRVLSIHDLDMLDDKPLTSEDLDEFIDVVDEVVSNNLDALDVNDKILCPECGRSDSVLKTEYLKGVSLFDQLNLDGYEYICFNHGSDAVRFNIGG